MPKNIFSKVFLESYVAKYQNYTDLRLKLDKLMAVERGEADPSILLEERDSEKGFNRQEFLAGKLENLEDALQDFMDAVMGFHFEGAYNLTEVKMYCDNICNNIDIVSKEKLEHQIRKYKEQYLALLEQHPNVNLFLTVLKRVFGKYYDGKFGNYSNFPNGYENSEAVIIHRDKSFVVTKAVRPNVTTLPSIFINNIDQTEKVLEDFIQTVKAQDAKVLYNIFKNEGYQYFTEEEKRMMLFETMILNATTFDLSNIDLFFERYRDFVADPILGGIKGVHPIGEKFGETLYCKIGRSDIEYETPYYLSFMLPNCRYELPNVRVSISEREKRAYIVAVQSSQRTPDVKEHVLADLKANMPKSGEHRFHNPVHLASLTMAFGFLNGLGIKNVNFVDYMPIRYYKTIKDKGMNDTEADNYLMRLTDKNISTFLRLETLADGIDLVNVPGTGYNMILKMEDEVQCANEYMQDLYNMGYNFGVSQAHELGIASPKRN